MTIGVGGSTAKYELSQFENMTNNVKPIDINEFRQRITHAQELMKKNNIGALYVNAGTNLYYFTGTRWSSSERMLGAIIPQVGDIEYISPYFETETLEQYTSIKGRVNGWQEHECPYALFSNVIKRLNLPTETIALDESTPFFIVDGVMNTSNEVNYINAKDITAGCRSIKSEQEIALLQCAKNMTLEVQKAAARILREGITTKEVETFIHQAHKKLGAPKGSYFCIVLFGKDSSFPHGVKNTKKLEKNDIVLIDTGCQIEGYNSDITRTYVFGEANDKQREMWLIEKNAQQAAFQAATLTATCEDVDIAARNFIAQQGLGPDYQTPGCPHRTGHGIGLDIHEWPYLVKNDKTLLKKGMCFSNEPMLVIPDEFGIRLEDHFYMTDCGPKWFTEPSYSIDDPFAIEPK